MSFLNSVVLFVLGAAVGSFLNVIIHRYRPDFFIFNRKIIGGRSRCPACGSILRWFELIPIVSFLIQGGKCRRCRAPLSWQEPLVELLSGLIVATVPFYFFSLIKPISPIGLIGLILIVAWVLIFLTWLLIFFIDLRWFVIPNELNVILAGLGLIIAGLKFFSNLPSLPVADYSLPIQPIHFSFLKQYLLLFSPFPESVFLNHLLGALAGGAVFGLIFFLGRGRAMGLGDVKLAAASGLVFGWPDIGLAVLLSFLFGGLVAVGLLVVGRRRLKDKIPFGPIFVLASTAVIFWGEKIVSGYFQLFSFPLG